MTKGRFSNPISAVLTGVYDLVKKKDSTLQLTGDDIIKGKTCLVTGADSGLGFGITLGLAKRGAKVIMACKNDYPKALSRAKKESQSEDIILRKLDLREPDSIHSFVQNLKKDKINIDISIHNAGVTPAKARKTSAGLDEMFMVNYLSKFILVNELLKAGLISNQLYKDDDIARKKGGRIIFVSSDSHQKASEIDFEVFGKFEDYTLANRAVNLYSYNKLILNTFAAELSRRLNSEDKIYNPVHIVCPGPVNSNIIRDAKGPLKWILKIVLFLFFKKPVVAASPIIYLSAALEMEQTTCRYLHMNNPKKMDHKVYDLQNGKKLWKKSEELYKIISS